MAAGSPSPAERVRRKAPLWIALLALASAGAAEDAPCARVAAMGDVPSFDLRAGAVLVPESHPSRIDSDTRESY